MAEALGMSLCHYVLALSLYVRGISVITLLPSREGLGKGPVGGFGFCCSFFLFLYRVPTIILLIFFLFSFFLFNFVPITKEIRTINRKILRTKHLLNWPTQFLLFKLTIVTVLRLFVFCPFVLMWRNRDSCQPASYSLFVGRRCIFSFCLNRYLRLLCFVLFSLSNLRIS